jgi:membrane protease YdiL (CAAX protease family)
MYCKGILPQKCSIVNIFCGKVRALCRQASLGNDIIKKVKNWSALLLKQHLDQAPWTIWQTFSGIFWTLVPYITFSLLVSFSSTSSVHRTKLVPISLQVDLISALVYFVYALMGEGIFLIAPAYFAKKTSSGDRRAIMQVLGFRSFNVKRVLPWMILLFLSFFLVNYIYQLVITTLHLSLQTNDQVVLQHGRTAPISTYVTLLAASIIAPVCEEVFFRSFILMGFLHSMPVWVAIVSSAFLFALVHQDPASFAVLFCIGLALAFLRWYSNSIWPGIIVHALNNVTSAILIILTLYNVIKG